MSVKERAGLDMEHIHALKNNEAFREYYLRRQAEKVAALKKSVLEDDFPTPQALWEARLAYRAAMEMTEFMSQDETAVRKELGLQSGESPSEAVFRAA